MSKDTPVQGFGQTADVISKAVDCACDARASAMVSVESALQTGLGLVTAVPDVEMVSLKAASGRILAKTVIAQSMMPPFDNSGMDGYAVRTSDFSGNGPWILPLSGRIAAGDSKPTKHTSAACMRIFTGAPIPKGADAVVMQEESQHVTGGIGIAKRPTLGQNIRFAGEDVAKGATVLQQGTRMGIREIAAAAGATTSDLCVYRRPRVALLCTGDEVASPGAKLTTGQINDVNGPMISAAATTLGADLISVEHCRDSKTSLIGALKRLSSNVDLIITTGGVSVGEEDHMRASVIESGGQISVSGVAIKPGKPVTLGRIGNAAYAGLPGNPVSAFVTWTIFVAPMLRRLSGSDDLFGRRRLVAVDAPLTHRPGRPEYRPAKLINRNSEGHDVVSVGPRVHSAQLGPLVAADGLVIIPSATETILQGQLVEFLPFNC